MKSATVHLVGVRLRAGGAWPFLGIPLREFTDQVVELETIMGREIEDLRDALCEARDDDSRFDLLDRGLVAGLLRKRAWRFDFALVALPNERKTSTNGGTLAPALSIKALVS